jgi:hypothetical protein
LGNGEMPRTGRLMRRHGRARQKFGTRLHHGSTARASGQAARPQIAEAHVRPEPGAGS